MQAPAAPPSASLKFHSFFSPPSYFLCVHCLVNILVNGLYFHPLPSFCAEHHEKCTWILTQDLQTAHKNPSLPQETKTKTISLFFLPQSTLPFSFQTSKHKQGKLRYPLLLWEMGIEFITNVSPPTQARPPWGWFWHFNATTFTPGSWVFFVKWPVTSLYMQTHTHKTPTQDYLD